MLSFPILIAIALYVAILFMIGFCSYRGHKTASDFLIGSRSLNFYLTALAAHASDMGSWLFMGFPAIIFLGGLFNAWIAVGLTLFMFLNWLFVAPKVRVKTEEYNSLTFSSFFESRFSDTSGLIRTFTAFLSFIFYTIYISAAIVGMGLLIETLFSIPYSIGITAGTLVVIPYLLLGGYLTLAWLDFFQGLFLLAVIFIVPLIALPKVGGWSGISHAIDFHGLSFSMLPSLSPKILLTILFSILGWGIGYFGQPHIVTKFMGIKKSEEMRKSMAVGMSWHIIALASAILIGLVSIAYFIGGIQNPELVFILIVKDLFSPFIMAFVLCAILAAVLSTMDSQILVLASSLTEDFYKRIFRKNASSRELLYISRLFVLLVAAIAYGIAFFKISTIYSLVLYAWSGLGSSFGPLLLFALYSKRTNKYGAWAGILIGGIVALIWPYLNRFFPFYIYPLVPGFLLSSLAIYMTSLITKHKVQPYENLDYK